MHGLVFFGVLLVTNLWATDWQGHRGARGLYPENTIGAMEEALKYPITTLEFDVVVSKDNKVIVSHEPWMNEEICSAPDGKPVKGKNHNLYKLTFDEIVKYDCGSKVHPRFPQQKKISVGKPALEKLLQIIEKKLQELNRTELGYNIEIKSTVEDEKKGYQPDVKTFSDLVIKTILAQVPASRFTIQSFDWRVLKYLHANHPGIRLVALSEELMTVEAVEKELGFRPHVFSPYFKGLTSESVKSFQDKGIKVIPWTVNEVESMRHLLKLKVDGIITDYPNLIEFAENKCKKGHNYFEGQCVKLPAHAVPSATAPGWSCKKGYLQKRSKCIKVNLPANSYLLEDGHSWQCKDGYVRYRGSCKKSQ